MFSHRRFCLVKGVGFDDKHKLLSFDNALIDAGVGNFNLVRVSSILPPFFEESNRLMVPIGDVLFMACSSSSISSEELTAVAVAVGIPKDIRANGVIMECTSDISEEKAIENACEMVLSAMQKRNIAIKEVRHIACSCMGKNEQNCTAFAGVALF